MKEISAFCEAHGVCGSNIASICDSFRENVITFEYEAYPDAKAVLKYFKDNGYENYIISNNFPELEKVFERLGLATEISGYFLSASVGYEKPRKEIYEYSKSEAGNPEICYMIGDNPVADYQGGMEAGMTPILVHNVEAGKVCCEQLTDLFDIIKG